MILHYVVDLERYNDGGDGLVGPFFLKQDAEKYVDTIADNYVRKLAIIRPVRQPE